MVVLAIGCPLGIGASSAQAQALGSVSPAPVYSYPARTWAYQLRRSDSYPAPVSSAQDDSQPNHTYSYYDQDGIEHDSRYPHWGFDTRRARPSGGG